MRPLESVLDRLKGVQESNGSYKALCPAHRDNEPSLSIKEGDDGKVLLRCFAGCTLGDVTEAIGLSLRDLFPEPSSGAHSNGKMHRNVAEAYDYTDAEGKLVFQTVRYEPKGFRQRRPDGQRGWVWNLKGVEPVLYRLPELLRAVRVGETVYIMEGEKDADGLAVAGLAATTSPMGAGKWRAVYSETLRGANVVVLPDNDEAGRKHAEQVARSLSDKAASVKVLELPDLPDKGDVSDWLDAGGTAEKLERMAREAPEWTPTAKPEIPVPVGRLLSEVEPECVAWLWPGRIPLGKLSVVDGDPGLGKSAMTTDLAARVSTGRPWPNGEECEAGGAVICSAEDGLADTIRPRLDAAGGDASRVLSLATVSDGAAERILVIPEDLDLIRQGIERVGAKLVIVDPLMAFLSGKVNAHKDQDVRRALAPLAKLAEETGAAVVVVRHLNQSSGGNSLYRGQGSIGIVGAARSGLLVAKHPEDEERRVLAPLKSNLAASAPSLAFVLTEASNGAVRVEWKGKTHHGADALLAAPVDPEERSALEEAMEFLRDVLGSGPVWSKQVEKDAREAEISKATLRRAKSELGVRSTKEGDGSWTWELPQDTQDERQDLHTPQLERLEHVERLPIDKGIPEGQGGQDEQGAQDEHVSGDGPLGPCIHNFPGGKGCALCDPDHPYRRRE